MVLLAITQAVDSVSKAVGPAVSTPASTPSQLSFLELIMKGGWVMIPIGILSVLAMYFAIERYLVIKKASRIDKTFMANIRDYLLSGKDGCGFHIM